MPNKKKKSAAFGASDETKNHHSFQSLSPSSSIPASKTRSILSFGSTEAENNSASSAESITHYRHNDAENLTGYCLLNSGAEPVDSEVVVVHGLDNYLYKTWMHPNGPLWLPDSQPDQLPSTRVMKYGYDAKHRFDQSLSPLKLIITSRSDTFVTSQLNSIVIVLKLD